MMSKGSGAERPVASTYLDQRFSHILGQIVDLDFAESGVWSRGGGSARGLLCWLGLLLDAAGWRDGCSGGSLGLDGSLAGGDATPTALDAAGGLAVLHDLIERLIEFSRHDGVEKRFGLAKCMRVSSGAIWLVEGSSPSLRMLVSYGLSIAAE